MEEKQTIKELQKIANDNAFYLCPIRVWNEATSVIDYRFQEERRLKKSRDLWMKRARVAEKKIKELKSNK